MNFIEAVKAMNDGKKVRRKAYPDKKSYIYYNFNMEHFSDIIDGIYNFSFGDFKATDWEVVEEKKTLSDKWFTVPSFISPEAVGKSYSEKDVRESLKRINEYIMNMKYSDLVRNQGKELAKLLSFIKKEVGEDLL